MLASALELPGGRSLGKLCSLPDHRRALGEGVSLTCWAMVFFRVPEGGIRPVGTFTWCSWAAEPGPGWKMTSATAAGLGWSKTHLWWVASPRKLEEPIARAPTKVWDMNVIASLLCDIVWKARS